MVLYKTARSKRRTIPDWIKVQAGEDAGAKLIEIWREYAACAARPYDVSGFRKEFRKWQAAAPAESVKEFAASDYHWQRKASVRPDILVLDDGATVRVRGGHLETFSRGVTNLFDAGPHHRKPNAIIFAGWGGAFSIEAARFCVDHKITVISTGWLGDLMTFVAPRPAQDAALVRAQCAAKPAPIARDIVAQKFRHYVATGRMTKTQFREFEDRLKISHTVKTILGIEAVGSSLSWLAWEGLQLTPRTGRTLPAWLARPFTHRASGIGAKGARHATDPINAMLNLAYAKEAGRLGSFLAASGACLAIGFLHQDKAHRHSVVFDALEPLRPLIDAKVRAFIGNNTFDRGDFLRLSTGHVRMVPGLIKVVLEKTVLPESDIKSAAEFMLGLISHLGFRDPLLFSPRAKRLAPISPRLRATRRAKGTVSK
jgi:CRISPR/Cas system-associated endonuclease Cas1